MKMKRQDRPIPHTRQKARAADVLGNASKEVQMSPKWQKYYRRLLKMREHLQRRQGGLAKDAVEERPTYSMHMADAGTDEFDRDFALSVVSSEQEALYEIDEALNRLEEGTYGICQLTGQKIERERLEAVPWARFSAVAEKQLEGEGAIGRAKLGRRETVPRSQPDKSDEDAD